MASVAYLFKAVVQFTSPLSEAAILTRITDLLVPEIDAKINQRLGPHIDGLTLEKNIKLHPINGVVNGFEAYPKYILTGDTNKSESFINTRIDRVYDDIKSLVEDDIAAQGGTSDFWHRHLTSGAIDG